MCEFCTQHGEGKKWYENISNYTEEVFHQVNSEENVRSFLNNLCRSMRVDVQRAHAWKRRLPRIYDRIAYPLVTRHLKKIHFGQIVPVEDIEGILGHFSSVVRLPCICRKVTRGENRRYCLCVGMDLTPVFKDLPDFSDFERLPVEEVRTFIRHLDVEGNTHSVWTLNTPFIGAICNCDSSCMAYRFEIKMKLGRAMWKGEYVAKIDTSKCSGCGECMKRCYFGGITFDRKNAKCLIDMMTCYGCGICRPACKNNAIELVDRTMVPQAAGVW